MLRPFLAHTILALAALAAVPPLAGGTLVPAMPQTIPSCTAPQPLNLPQPAGIGGGASMAYNGTDFAAAYSQNGAIRFRRFFSDGSPVAPEQFVGSAMPFLPAIGEYTRPALVWDGAGYGVAWFAQVDGFAVPMFRRLNADGTPAGAAVQAGSVGATATADGIRLALAASPDGFALVWSDDRNTATSGRDLFLTHFDRDGTISNAGAWHDLPATAENPGAQDRPAIAWNAARNYYTLVWQDGRSGSISEIYSNDLYSWGGFVYASDIRQVTSAGNATEPALAKAGSGYGLVWTDSRSGLLASYFVRLDDSGWLNGTPVQISPDDSESPALAWLGGEFGAVWTTAGEAWFRRISGSGAPVGAAVAISSGYPARSPALAAGRPGYLMLGSDSDALSYANLSAVAIGCTLDSTPPGCPGALSGAENGAGAALSWLPAADAETGIAYYRVYRNGVAIGDTDATTFTAPMLDGVSNTFGVQSVNAAQMQNTACTATVTLVSSPPASRCPSPTPGTRRPTGDIFSAFNAALAWDGREFGAAYAGFDATGGNRIYFRRLFADGTPDGAPQAVSAIASADIPVLVWTGSEYGLAYTARPGAYWQIFFQRISREGALIGAPVKISVYGDAETANANGPALAWSGSGYLAAWRDERNGATNRDIYATWLNPDGTVANGGLDHDLPVVTEPGHQFSPTVVWSTTGGYVLAWQDRRSTVRYEIWGALWYPQSVIIPFTAPLATPPSGSSYAPRLASSGANLGLVWEDNRGGEVSEVYFRRLSAQGEPLGAEQRITSAPDLSSAPRIVWNGSEYGVFWGDARNGGGSAMEPYYQRLAADGGLLGGNLRLAADARAVYTNAAWSGKGWLVSVGSYDALTGDVGVSEHFALGCGADATGASCPSNPVAYGVSGTSATFSWLPAQDSESGVAYYQVYLDNAPAGTTAANYFNFSGLATGTTYNLAVQPVNGAGVTAACTTALYVRTGSSLTLMLNKSGGDAGLAWTDGGQNNYQVYRGVRPQVMGLELSTPATAALDTGALNDTLSYFYSIDVPFE